MIPVTFDITQSSVSEGETIRAYVQAVPRTGETVVLHLGRVGVATRVLEVIHSPALNLNNFPSVSIRVRILNEQQPQAAKARAA